MATFIPGREGSAGGRDPAGIDLDLHPAGQDPVGVVQLRSGSADGRDPEGGRDPDDNR